MKVVTPQEAAKVVKSGDRVGLPMMRHPQSVAFALAARRDELRDVTLVSNNWYVNYPWFQPGWEQSFRVLVPYITRPFIRRLVREKKLDLIPQLVGLDNGIHPLEAGRRGIYSYLDVYMLKLTPPNKNGYCSFGNVLFLSPTALRTAKTVIAEFDPTLPWSYGEYAHVSEIDLVVESREFAEKRDEIGAVPMVPPDEAEKTRVIGANAAELVRDGDTLEIGTGVGSEAILEFLHTRNDLGLDSEILYPPVIEMIKEGIITGKRKNSFTGKVITTGTIVLDIDPRQPAMMQYFDHNPVFEFHDLSWVLNVPRIAQNDNMVSINSALAIDLSGQICVDYIGSQPYAGLGGQAEYVIGSHYSKGGRAITVIPSTAKGGTISRIVPQFEQGTVIGIPAYYTDWVVTEHGAVNLEGRSRRERADAIISIADPAFQGELRKEARNLFGP